MSMTLEEAVSELCSGDHAGKDAGALTMQERAALDVVLAHARATVDDEQQARFADEVTGVPRRQFWFSQALEDAWGGPWPVGASDDDPHFYSDGGLIEKRGDTFYAEGHLRPWHDLDLDAHGLPFDAVRLAPMSTGRRPS